MKIVAVVCNAVLFVVTGSIVLTEGIPGKVPYMILTLLPLSVPLLSLVVLLRGRAARNGQRTPDDPSSGNALIHRMAVFCNLVFIALTCWAAVAQYPYREGSEVIPFALLMVFTPIFTLMLLIRSGKGKEQKQQGTNQAEKTT